LKRTTQLLREWALQLEQESAVLLACQERRQPPLPQLQQRLAPQVLGRQQQQPHWQQQEVEQLQRVEQAWQAEFLQSPVLRQLQAQSPSSAGWSVELLRLALGATLPTNMAKNSWSDSVFSGLLQSRRFFHEVQEKGFGSSEPPYPRQILQKISNVAPPAFEGRPWFFVPFRNDQSRSLASFGLASRSLEC
jgi:hypothetical protein